MATPGVPLLTQRSPNRQIQLASAFLAPDHITLARKHVQFELRSTRAVRPSMAGNAGSDQVYPGPILEASDVPGPRKSKNLVFYTHVLCPFAERVWLTLLEKQVEHDLVHVDLSRKPAWYKGLNPRGLVPCVVYRDRSIIESEDICRFPAINFLSLTVSCHWKFPPSPDPAAIVSASLLIEMVHIAACMSTYGSRIPVQVFALSRVKVACSLGFLFADSSYISLPHVIKRICISSVDHRCSNQCHRWHSSMTTWWSTSRKIIEHQFNACRWVDEQLDGPPLMPPEGPKRELAERAIRLGSSVCSACLDVISADNNAAWSVGQNASRAQLDSFVSACEDLGQIVQQSGGPFLTGAEPGVADMMSWPFVHRALFCAKHFSSFDALAEGNGLSTHARAWIAAMQSRPAAQLTLPDTDLLHQALESTGRLDWFDYQTAKVDRLHPHLGANAQAR